jgi:hypothetical protein
MQRCILGSTENVNWNVNNKYRHTSVTYLRRNYYLHHSQSKKRDPYKLITTLKMEATGSYETLVPS